MIEVLKEKLDLKVAKWNEEIASSPEKVTTIDLAHLFMELFMRDIAHVCLGKEVTDTILVDIDLHQKNGPSIRNSIRDYIQKRKNGEERNDLLSLFLKSPDVFDEDLIIDEILDFYGTGVIIS